MLELKDGPMFARVMRDEELCKEVLEAILGFEIERIEYLNTEQAFDSASGAKGVRLDVFAKSTGKAYDIEMQTATHSDLVKRMRYYQGLMDVSLLDKGLDYSELEESYIILICNFDLFGKELPAYHLERVCEEDPTIDVENESHWLVLNACAWDKDSNYARSKLLEYIHNGNAEDGLSAKLDEAVSNINSDAEWRRRAMGFMTLEMSHRAELSYAKKKGIEEGETIQGKRYDLLISKLLDLNRIEDLKHAANDDSYRDELFKEFGIS